MTVESLRVYIGHLFGENQIISSPFNMPPSSLQGSFWTTRRGPEQLLYNVGYMVGHSPAKSGTFFYRQHTGLTVSSHIISSFYQKKNIIRVTILNSRLYKGSRSTREVNQLWDRSWFGANNGKDYCTILFIFWNYSSCRFQVYSRLQYNRYNR